MAVSRGKCHFWTANYSGTGFALWLGSPSMETQTGDRNANDHLELLRARLVPTGRVVRRRSPDDTLARGYPKSPEFAPQNILFERAEAVSRQNDSRLL